MLAAWASSNVSVEERDSRERAPHVHGRLAARKMPMTTLAGPGAASTGPQAAQRLRAVVLGPRGGGTTRRRASDAFRLGLAVVVVAVSIPVMRANSAAELGIVHALNPPPQAIRWLVTAVFWIGSAGVIGCLVIFGLLVPRLAAVRWIALAGLVTWAACALLGEVLGPVPGGRPRMRCLALILAIRSRSWP
jgi:hypothetical protein